jgi:predicted nucleotidyltransferase
MKQNILSHLKDVEQQYDIKVLYAVESGSRAWGFHSEESDWDVRFIYVHKLDWYLKVNAGRDVIEEMYDDNVDLVGWDLRKTLQLFRKSNPSLMEWLHSPIIYYADDDFLSQMLTLEPRYFNAAKMMYHYENLYIKHDKRYLQNTAYPLKRFLYYLRGILACRWLEEYGTLPPVLFAELVNAIVVEENICYKINELLALKKKSKENDQKEVDTELVEYAKRWADYYEQKMKSFYPEKNIIKDIGDLDNILREFIINS